MWIAESQIPIHQQCLCSLSFVTLFHYNNYNYVASYYYCTDANKPVKKEDQHNYVCAAHVGLGYIFQYYRYLGISGLAISISPAFLHFNNIICAIYNRILPCNPHHYTAVLVCRGEADMPA